MTRDIEIVSMAYPDEPGYCDLMSVVDADTTRTLWAGACSCCPNPRRPWYMGGARWDKAYGWIAPGQYVYRVVRHAKYGKCCLINCGGRVPTRNANVRHDGQSWMEQVFVHCGQTSVWRGSAGCITIPPVTWPSFVALMPEDYCGVMYITDNTGA